MELSVMEYLVSLAMLAYSHLGFERSVPTESLLKSYDFIVVGGGTAGAIVASRLSENPAINVLLLDSGGSSSNYTDIPYTYLYLHRKLTHDALKCFGADRPKSGACWQSEGKNQYCEICESRILGGGSTVNGFTYVRGTRVDFDSWNKVAPGWSYNEVLPYMKALENFDGAPTDSPSRGNSGPVHVTVENGDFYNLQETWLQAGQELGHYINSDVNGRYQLGFGRAQNNLYNGARQTMDNVFLQRQQKERKNLHIKMFSHVTRILFSGTTATGVEFVRTGDYSKKYTALASKEVILSAGAIQTPIIMINSGVGPSDQVAWVNQNLVAHLPGVGQNLQDHPKLHMIQFKINDIYKRSNFKRDIPQLEDHVTWVKNRTGFMATGSASGLAFLRTSNNSAVDDAQIELALSGGMEAKVVLNAAESRGQVRVRTRDIYDGTDPYVELNLLNKTADIRNLVAGARVLKDVFQTKAFRDIGAYSFYKHPSCDKFVIYSDQYLECLVKDATVSGYHYAGTVAMGKVNDPMAVLNERLKVRNVFKLRVADASVMPTIVRANPNAAVMLIGWKAAEMIKQDYGI